MYMVIEGVEFLVRGLKDFTEEEGKNYLKYIKENAEGFDDSMKISEVWVSSCDDGKVDLHYKLLGSKFERIRRITGKRLPSAVKPFEDCRLSARY